MSLLHALQPRTVSLLLAAAATAILLAALGLQYLGALPPCHLCILQRYPYVVVIALGVLGGFWQPRLMLGLSALVLLGGAGLAGYHLGVEQGWWALPAGCAAGGAAQSVEELKRLLAEAAPTCDQVRFTFLGLSLAAWNGLISLALAALTLAFAVAGGRQAREPAAQTG
jgi:disulfide bond formation protein DsbB